ncbi:MAG: adenylate kinase family protein [Methanophagales archaeon]|nr:adenylate kinase family protein [Methanophagales archaeon]
MILAITGTPGTGKSSLCKAYGRERGEGQGQGQREGSGLKIDCLDLNAVIAEKGFHTGVDTESWSLIADIDRLEEYVRHKEQEEKEKSDLDPVLVIEGHLAHLLNPDVVIVLRTDPSLLIERLKQKAFPLRKIRENVDAEILDVILIEAVELCKIVYEIDTSRKRVEEVSALVRAIIDVERERGEDGNERRAALRHKYKPGSIDWTRQDNTGNE